MAAPPEPNNHHKHINNFIHNTASNFLCLLPYPTKTIPSKPSKISMPILFADSPPNQPIAFLSSDSTQSTPPTSSVSSSAQGVSPGSASVFPSTVRISGLKSSSKGGGPAFVGQVFSMCDLSGTGLMAVSTHFDIPFISKRSTSLSY